MIYPLPAHNLYGNAPVSIEIPDSWEVVVCDYAGADSPAMSYDEIAAAIDRPIGRLPIREAAKGKKDAIIIIDDISRPTPDELIAKAVIAELVEAGVPRDKIRFMAAVGSHRAMSREEFVRKLGEDIVTEFRVYSHNPFFNNTLVGHTDSGVAIELNSEVVSADFKVAIGNIVPHGTVGIAGGAKTIVPGIASLETIRNLHSLGEARWDNSIGGFGYATKGAELLGLDFKIDVLLNKDGDVAKLYCGDVNRLVNENIDEIKAFYSTPYEMEGDIVIANNYFKPSEPNVAIAYNGIVFCVKKGGSLVVSAHTPLGAACHYLMGIWGDSGISGPHFKGYPVMARRLKNYFAFSTYQDKGTAVTYQSAGEQLKWVHKWEQILAEVGTEPKKLIIYPHATVGYYGEDVNIEKKPSPKA